MLNTATREDATHTNIRRLHDDRLLIVSNRAPIEHRVDDSGNLRRKPASGGLATALGSPASDLPFTWIAAASTVEDSIMSYAVGPIRLGDAQQLSYVTLEPGAYDLHYKTFCNPALWFVQHGLRDRLLPERTFSAIERAWRNGYVPVNRAFARRIVVELLSRGPQSRVMLHDYHLYLTPRFIRDLGSQALLQHFIHVPWPEPRAWAALPPAIVTSICSGLLANDSVVFQTVRSARNFVLTCRDVLSGVDFESDGAIMYQGRRTRVSANPISVDIATLRQQVAAPEARPHFDRLAGELGEFTIVRVDRLDPSKNIAAGFRAFDALLCKHPEWLGRVRFLAFLVPSRTDVPEYQAYVSEVFALVESINARHERNGWRPISVFHEHNRLQALVGLVRYDVLLVNSVADGMNLVAKEGPVVNQRNGVLVLSTTAGCFDELQGGALHVQPNDIEGTAETLHRALSLPAEERRQRAIRLRQAVARHDFNRWLEHQLQDLATLECAVEPTPAGRVLAVGSGRSR